MNLSIKDISLVLIFSCFTKIAYAQDCKANLIIKSDIDALIVFIDDSLRNNNTDLNYEIEKGLHIISVIENTKRWNGKNFTDTIRVENCDDLILEYNFHSDILLETEPQDVYVFRNDSLIGFTPLFISSDFDELQLQKPGYLAKKVSRNDVFKSGKITLDFIGDHRKENFYDGMLFKILVGTAIALGATTAHFKLQADKKFDEYQVTGDPSLLDETDKYDLISGVTFVALQINFGLIIYMFLTD